MMSCHLETTDLPLKPFVYSAILLLVPTVPGLCALRAGAAKVDVTPPRFPVISIWEASLSNEEVGLWQAEAALIARPHLEVDVWRLPPGGYEFFAGIAAGKTVGAAIDDAVAGAGNFDLAATFNIMICAGIVIGLESPEISQ